MKEWYEYIEKTDGTRFQNEKELCVSIDNKSVFNMLKGIVTKLSPYLQPYDIMFIYYDKVLKHRPSPSKGQYVVGLDLLVTYNGDHKRYWTMSGFGYDEDDYVYQYRYNVFPPYNIYKDTRLLCSALMVKTLWQNSSTNQFNITLNGVLEAKSIAYDYGFLDAFGFVVKNRNIASFGCITSY